MGWGEFGNALEDWILQKETDKVRTEGMGALGTLNKGMGASEDYQAAQKRTDSWLASLSPEDLAKVDSSTKKVASNFEGVGDVSRFDADRSARDLGLTSKFAGMPEVQAYFKSNQDVLSKKKDAEINKALEDALSEMNRNKQAQGLNELEEQAGVPKGDYKLSSPRDISVKYGLPKYEDKRIDRFMSDFVTGPEGEANKKLNADPKKDPNELQYGNRAGLISYFNRPEKIKETLAQLDYFKENYDVSDEDYNSLKTKAQTGESYDVREYITERLKGGQKNKLAIDKEYKLIDPRVKTKASTTTAGLRATKDEGAILSETSAERLGDFDASISQLGELVTGMNNPDSPQGPVAQWRKINPLDWKAQGKQQLVASTKQLIGKALEGGVLRKEDEDKYAKILPTMGDTYESAKLKTEQLSAMLNNAYTAKRSALKNAGYDVKNFSGGVSVGKKEPVKPTSEYNPTLVEDETTAALKRSEARRKEMAEIRAALSKLGGK